MDGGSAIHGKKTVYGSAAPETVVLDNQGDVTLVVRDVDHDTGRSFLVSSQVLSLTSPVFCNMFGTNFKEGHRRRSETKAPVFLEEDDPYTMELILRVLHHKTADVPLQMDANHIRLLAVHCDKYDCSMALKPWIAQWCTPKQISTDTKPKDIGHVLLAAYMFRSLLEFPSFTAQAAKCLPRNFASEWDSDETLNLLPHTIRDDLTNRIASTVDLIHEALQSVETRLREVKTVYAVPRRLCVNCGRVHPETAKKCNPCKASSALVDRYCTVEYRVSEYFAVLRQSELWPSVTALATPSPAEILSRIELAIVRNKHQCAAKTGCPLAVQLTVLGLIAKSYFER